MSFLHFLLSTFLLPIRSLRAPLRTGEIPAPAALAPFVEALRASGVEASLRARAPQDEGVLESTAVLIAPPPPSFKPMEILRFKSAEAAEHYVEELAEDPQPSHLAQRGCYVIALYFVDPYAELAKRILEVSAGAFAGGWRPAD